MTKLKKALKNIKESGQMNIASGAPLVLIFSLVAFFLYIHFTTFSPLSLEKTGFWGKLNHDNIVKYFVGLIVLAVAFLILRFITRWIHHRASGTVFFTPLPRTVGVCILLAYILVFVAFFVDYLFRTELGADIFGATPANYAWRHHPLTLIIGYVGAVVVWTLYQAVREKDARNSTAYLAYFIAMLLSYFAFLSFNYGYGYTDLHHGIAYTESIYNVYSGAPYNIVTTGIYGHYGIFLGAILKVIGGNAITLAHMIALIGALSTAACAYIIHNLTSKNYIRIPAILACVMSITVLRRGNYWQLQPHRVLFPLILIAFVTYLVKHNAFSKVKIGLGYLLCMIATVWSTESGMFCAVAYTLALIVYFWQSDAWYSKKMWLRYAMLICGTVFSLLGAILFVNLYNLIVGGGWIFKDFFFPFGVDDYMNGVLKEDMRGGAQVWMLVLLLFVALLFFGLYHTKFLRRNAQTHDGFAPVFMAIATVGLLNFSYFANRAAYLNLDICSQLACIAMVVFADRFLGDWRDILKKKLTFARVSAAAMSLLSLVVLTVLSTQIVFSTHRLAGKYNTAIFDDELFEKQTQEFADIVPEDYMVLGLGASTFNLQLGRTSEYCYRDFSDLYVGGTEVADTIVEDALEYGKLAFYIPHNHSGTTQLMERILKEGNFVLTAEGKVGEAVVKCYEKQ